jgi:hypothetical protein
VTTRSGKLGVKGQRGLRGLGRGVAGQQLARPRHRASDVIVGLEERNGDEAFALAPVLGRQEQRQQVKHGEARHRRAGPFVLRDGGPLAAAPTGRHGPSPGGKRHPHAYLPGQLRELLARVAEEEIVHRERHASRVRRPGARAKSRLASRSLMREQSRAGFREIRRARKAAPL